MWVCWGFFFCSLILDRKFYHRHSRYSSRPVSSLNLKYCMQKRSNSMIYGALTAHCDMGGILKFQEKLGPSKYDRLGLFSSAPIF